MFEINFTNTDITVSYAAQELKKYLRMLMTRCGDIPLSFGAYNPNCFNVGLMSDFNLKSDVEDMFLDDEIYIDADKTCGIIAGNNVRSVLLAVYRYLKAQGCIWLFPGPDGEKIPSVAQLKPVKYNHKPPYRFRGQCDEGSHTMSHMLDAIEFTPKVGLNTFMMEGDVPGCYYDQGKYVEKGESDGAPISEEKRLQWRRQCEDEIKKRGLMYHAYGHGWTAYPFGFEDLRELNLTPEQLEEEYKKDKYRHAAMINGKRTLFGDFHLNTNPCLSNPETRKLMVDYVADYVSVQNNIDFLHVWLGDAPNSHCECEECVKKTATDWYVVLMNEIDAELTRRGLDSKIVFISYLDTFWAPKTERINNPARFKLLFAPIKRFYTKSYMDDADLDNLTEFKVNNLVQPRNMTESLGYLKKWQEVFPGDCFCYEYYFWRPYMFDMGSRMLARTIYNDMKGIKKHNIRGIVEDGTQRPYFPNGFQFYVYGEMLYDPSREFEDLESEYYLAAYGEDWKQVANYMDKIDACADFLYLSGLNPIDENGQRFYNPTVADGFNKIPAIVDEFMPVIESHLNSDDRALCVSWDLVRWHAKYVKMFATAAALKAVGEDQKAYNVYEQLLELMKPLDLYRGDCFDYFSMKYTLRWVFRIRKVVTNV